MSKHEIILTEVECQKLFDLIVNDPRDIKTILNQYGLTLAQFYRSIQNNPALWNQYENAQKIKSEYYAETAYNMVNSEPDSQRARIMLDCIKWYTSKINPKKFGDKIDVNVSGAIDLNQAIIDATKRLKNDSEIIDAEIIPENDNDIFK